MVMIEEDIKNLAWNTFKQTGNINTFMEFIQMENMNKSLKQDQIENDKQNNNL